jgi:hypothetical protein
MHLLQSGDFQCLNDVGKYRKHGQWKFSPVISN